MKVKCISNNGASLVDWEYTPVRRDKFGRFNSTYHTEFGGVTVGEEYLVAAMIYFQEYIAYLVDEDDLVVAYPCQLFTSIDERVSRKWKFRLVDLKEEVYPFVQAIWGYPELCDDKNTYEDLIVEKTQDSLLTYFKRKTEMLVEFPDSRLDSAKVVDGAWISCPVCDDVWEMNRLSGMTQCTNGHYSNNPLWVG